MTKTINGVINIKKEKGYTSHDVVACVRKIIGKKIKVGHTGTLDPEATGVLPVCVGRCTKLSDRIMSNDKVYIGKLKLGIKTDTQDIWGKVLETADVDVLEKDIYEVVKSFKGIQQQLPPMYSAIKINGKKLYELAREGKEIERKKRKIEIKDIEVLNIEKDEIEIKVKCSKGTYIRSLFTDISEKLGTIGTMSELKRIKTGVYKIENSITLDELKKLNENNHIEDGILSLEKILESYEFLKAPSKCNKYLYNGNKVSINYFSEKLENKREYVIVDCNDIIMGIYIVIGELLVPVIMLKN